MAVLPPDVVEIQDLSTDALAGRGAGGAGGDHEGEQADAQQGQTAHGNTLTRRGRTGKPQPPPLAGKDARLASGRWRSCPASTRTHAASAPTATRRAPGRCGSTRASRRPRRRTSASGCCSSAGQTGLSVAFDLPTQLGLDSDDPLARGEVGRTGVAIDSLDDMLRLFDGIPLGGVSTSMTINAPAAVLLLLYELAGAEHGVAPGDLRGTVQNDVLKEYAARGNYIFPPRPVDAPHRRALPLLQRAPAALQHDLDLRVPHPRGRLERGAGARLHARQRHRLRRGGARRRASSVDVFAPAPLVLLQRPQRRLRRGREVPRRAQDLGDGDARALRRARRALARAALPRPDRRLDADRAGPADERRARRAAGLRRDRRRLPVAAHERLRRGARAADRALGDARAAHAAGAAARVRRRRRARPVRRLGVRRGPDRRDRARGARADRRDRRARRRGRGDRERLDQGPDRGRGLRAAARRRERRDA